MDVLYFAVLALVFIWLIDSWHVRFFNTAILLFGDWSQGLDVNWGFEAFCYWAFPAAWIFALCEIYILYFR